MNETRKECWTCDYYDCDYVDIYGNGYYYCTRTGGIMDGNNTCEEWKQREAKPE